MIIGFDTLNRNFDTLTSDVAMPRGGIPKYRKHPNGQAFVQHRSIDRPQNRMYLGKYGTAESRRQYEEIIRKIRQSEQSQTPTVQPDQNLSNNELVEQWLARCEEYYRDEDGRLTSEMRRQVQAVGPESPFVSMFGHEPAAEFGPRKLKAVRQEWIERELSRVTINALVRAVRRMFKWGSSQEIIPPSTYHGLLSVDALRKGRSQAREMPPVPAATWSEVKAVLPFLNPTIAAMVQVQFICGMRPQDVCRMRSEHIKRKGDVWLYVPPRHKTDHFGHPLVKGIPKAAQIVLQPFLDRVGDNGSLFVPRKQGRSGEHHTPGTYLKNVSRGCQFARDAGVDVRDWTPNQLRHGIATKISGAVGEQAAQRWLGHRSLKTTGIYVEKETAELIEIARRVDELMEAESKTEEPPPQTPSDA